MGEPGVEASYNKRIPLIVQTDHRGALAVDVVSSDEATPRGQFAVKRPPFVAHLTGACTRANFAVGVFGPARELVFEAVSFTPQGRGAVLCAVVGVLSGWWARRRLRPRTLWWRAYRRQGAVRGS